MNEDQLELIERRLSEKVSERVRPALFRVYAAIGAAVMTVLGLVGWDMLSDIKTEIKQEIKSEIEGSIVSDIKEKRKEISDLVAESKYLAKQTNEIVVHLDKKLQEFEPQATQLDETIKKVESINVDAKNIMAMYSTEVEPLVENFQAISSQLKELAEQVSQLNLLSESRLSESNGSPSFSDKIDSVKVRGAAISSIIAETSDLEKVIKDRKKITVFFQFSGAPRSQAEELSVQLKNKGYIVPGEDREGGAARKHEVRYFHQIDEEAARTLANDTTMALKELGYPDNELTRIEPVSYVTYKNKKPREGVIELWAELPRLYH